MEANPAVIRGSGAGRSRVSGRAVAIASSTWTLGALVFCLTWGGGLMAPHTVSIDDSLHAGLNMAAVQGLQFGPDIVFTYGPLGFLKSYLVFYEWPARLALVYGIALHFALATSLVWALRRNFPAAVAVLVAICAAMIMRGDLGAVAVRDDAGVVGLAVIWCIAALSAGAKPWVRGIVVYGGGAFAALEMLTKLNTGLIVFAVCAIAVLAMDGDRRRQIAGFTATFSLTLVALWFASGQGVDDVWSFLSGSWQVISGYSSGARLDWETRDYDYVLVPAIIVVAAAVAWVSSAGLPRLRRAAVLLIGAIVAFTAAKGGLVSHDLYHMATFFGTMAAAVAAFPLPDRALVRGGAVAVLLGIILAALTTRFPGYPLADPVENLRNGASTVAALADGGRLEAEIDSARASVIADHAIDERSLDLLAGHDVHVDPSEASAAWAYGLDWDPLPVFQPYVAWTEELDRLNAEAVESPDGPDRILRQNLNALGRFPSYESPAAMLAMLCNFEPLRTTEKWQVLGRVPDRCGEPRSLGTVDAEIGEPVPVPDSPGDVVFAKVEGIQVGGLERLRAFLHRAEGRSVRFENETGEPPSMTGTLSRDGSYIFIGDTAAGGLIMRAPTDADSPQPFRLAPQAERVAFTRGDDSGGALEIEFFAMPIEQRSR
jgi:hypothetical protein